MVKKKLNIFLLELLSDQSITFVGRRIKGDMTRIAKDFNCAQKLINVNVVDIGTMARARYVVKSTGPKLAHLVAVVLEEELDKVSGVRISDKWSARQLSNDHIKYGALDVIQGLEIYFKLDGMPDINTPLSLHEATEGRVVDIMPSSRASMTARAATAQIEPCQKWSAPEDKCKTKSQNATDSKCLVTITQVFASSLDVPNIRRNDGKNMTLGDYGVTPFKAMLPLQMVVPHISSDSIDTTPGAAQQSNILESSTKDTAGINCNSGDTDMGGDVFGESNMGGIDDKAGLDSDQAFDMAFNHFFTSIIVIMMIC